MNAEKFDELRDNSVKELEKLFHNERVMAEQVIKSEVGKMIEDGRAMQLSDEEERLLASFRRFKATCKPGGVFKWQTRPTEGVIAPPDPVLVSDPQEVSA